MAELLKPFDLSSSQYNVLRILRGATEPMACGQIADRMVSRDPDITRLLDRMEARGLISRARDGQDRRVVKTQIAGKGLGLLDEIAAFTPAASSLGSLRALGKRNSNNWLSGWNSSANRIQKEQKRKLYEKHLPDRCRTLRACSLAFAT